VRPRAFLLMGRDRICWFGVVEKDGSEPIIFIGDIVLYVMDVRTYLELET